MAFRVVVVGLGRSVEKAIRMALSESEFEIYPFQDAPGVLAQLREINPDVVFLSHSLSPKNIGDFSKQFQSQAQFHKTSLVLVKGLFEPLDGKKMSELDFNLVLQLPFDSRTLEKGVRALIEKKNDPQTLPEEPFLDDWIEGGEAGSQEEKIRTLVRTETSEAEKRIINRLLPEMKTWLQDELEEIKNRIKSKE